jgi:Outer membrane protein beta-barrel domain
MNKGLHDIDDLFRSSINEHVEFPSAWVWDQLNNELSQKQTGGGKRSLFLKRWAAAVLLMVCGGVFAWWGIYAPGHKHMAQNDKVVPKAVTLSPTYRHNESLRIQTNKSEQLSRSGLSDSIADSNTAGAVTLTAKKANEMSGTFNIPENNRYLKVAQQNQLHLTFRNNGPLEERSKMTSHPSIDKFPGDIPQKMAPDLNISIYKQLQMSQVSLSGLTETLSNKDHTPIVAAGTGPSSPKPKHTSLVIDAFFAPGFTMRSLREDHHGFPSGPRPDEMEEGERKTVTTSTGILLNYQVNNKWSVGSGIYGFRSVTDIASKKLYAEHDDQGRIRYRLNCSVGYSYIQPQPGTNPATGDSINALSSKMALQYIAVPLFAKYTISRGRFQLAPTAGLGMNFLTTSQAQSSFDVNGKQQNKTQAQGNAPWFLNGTLGLYADYSLGNRVALFLEPVYQFSITSITKDLPVKSYPKTAGFSIGLHFRL